MILQEFKSLCNAARHKRECKISEQRQQPALKLVDNLIVSLAADCVSAKPKMWVLN